MSTINKKEGVSKVAHPFFMHKKVELSQARPLLFPKVFVTLGTQKLL